MTLNSFTQAQYDIAGIQATVLTQAYDRAEAYRESAWKDMKGVFLNVEYSIANWIDAMIEGAGTTIQGQEGFGGFQTVQAGMDWAKFIKLLEYDQEEKEKEKKEGGVKEGLKGAGKFAKEFGKRKFIQAVQSLTGLAKQFIDMGTAPVMEGIMAPLKALGTILNIILIPLKPFLFGIELIGKILEAAMAPIQVEIWEGLSETFEDMVDMIPDITEKMWEWIESQGGLGPFIDRIAGALMSLMTSLTKGDLINKLMNLSMGIMDLALKLVQPKTLESLLVIATTIMTVADIIIDVFGPILNWLGSLDPLGMMTVLYGMGLFIAMMYGMATSMGPWGALIGATLWTAAWIAGVAISSFQEGGEVPYTGLIYAHQGETVHKEGIDDDILETMEEMVSYQKQILKMKEEKYDYEP